MLNELFEKFPEYVAFQILTYRPHPDAELIKEYWREQRERKEKINSYMRTTFGRPPWNPDGNWI
jgi:hypothetical protein